MCRLPSTTNINRPQKTIVLVLRNAGLEYGRKRVKGENNWMQKEGRSKYKIRGQQTFLVRDPEGNCLSFVGRKTCGDNHAALLFQQGSSHAQYVNESLNLCFNKTFRALTCTFHIIFIYHKQLFLVLFFPII